MQPGCNTELVTAKLAAYAPTADPFKGESLVTDRPNEVESALGVRVPVVTLVQAVASPDVE